MRTITAPDLLSQLITQHGSMQQSALIDVRSELEFERGSIPGFINAPIMRQSERHAVGIAYKGSGFDAALKIASELVAPYQKQRLDGWIKTIRATPSQSGVIMCWRGGMRSRYACDWLATGASDLKIHQLEGGYKSLRRALIQQFDAIPNVMVITGSTGSGKTALLRALGQSYLDLEAAAHHRGSVFGAFHDQHQPSQATFEHALALQIAEQRNQSKILFVEDESRMIGACSIPTQLVERMRAAPMIVVESSLEERAQRIHSEYIASPMQRGLPLTTIETQALNGIKALRRRLDSSASTILEQAQIAFRRGADAHDHHEWIAALLTHYYDKRYTYASAKFKRKLAFKGNFSSCLQWAQQNLAPQLQRRLG